MLLPRAASPGPPFPRVLAAVLLTLILPLLAAPARAFHSPHDAIEAGAISPDFARDRTLFVSLPRFNLLLRSRDAGASFEVVNAGLDTAYVQGLAVSPDYARDRTLYCIELTRAFVSRDGADRWEPLALPDELRDLRHLALSPDFGRDGTLALCTGRDGLWVSRDRGASWTRAALPAGDAGAAVAGATDEACFSPAFAADRTLFALHSELGLLRSTDGGGTFAALAVPAAAALQALAASAPPDGAGPPALWVGTRGRGVLASRDGGASWRAEPEPVALQNVLHLAVAHDAAGAPVLFASTATDGVFVRDPRGAWSGNRSGFREPTDQTSQHYLGALPSPDFARDRTVFAATFEGLYVSDAGGDGWRWLDVLQPQIVRNLALSPQFADDGRLWLSTYGLGLLEVDTLAGAEGPPPHRRLDTLGWMFPDGIAVSPDLRRDGTLMVGAPNRLLLSTDGGASARPTLSAKKSFARALAFAPDYARSGIAFAYLSTYTGSNPIANRFARTGDHVASWQDTNIEAVDDMAFGSDWEASGRMYAVGPDGLYRSLDRGLSFARVDSLDARGCCSVALARGAPPDGDPEGAAPDILLVCSRHTGLHLSRDDGATWRRLDGLPAGTRFDFVELSPGFADDGTAFAGPRTDGVFVTRDGGATWTRSPGGARVVLSMDRSPTYARDRVLLVGSYDGAWISRDAAASWEPLPVVVPAGWTPVFSK